MRACEKAYKLPAPRKEKNYLPFDRVNLSDFARLCSLAYKENKIDEKFISSLIENFNRHFAMSRYGIDPSANKQVLDEILIRFSAIYEILKDPQIPADKKTMIACKIEERIGQCTAGFLIGLQEITSDITGNAFTMESMLYSIRYYICHKLAFELAQSDVHKHNIVFIEAKDLRFGVKPITEKENDSYYSNIYYQEFASSCRDKIKKAFDLNYQFPYVFWHIMDEIHTLYLTEARDNSLTVEGATAIKTALKQLFPQLTTIEETQKQHEIELERLGTLFNTLLEPFQFTPSELSSFDPTWSYTDEQLEELEVLLKDKEEKNKSAKGLDKVTLMKDMNFLKIKINIYKKVLPYKGQITEEFQQKYQEFTSSIKEKKENPPQGLDEFLFLTDEDTGKQTLNVKKIRGLLWQELSSNGYFAFSREEKEKLSIIFDVGAEDSVTQEQKFQILSQTDDSGCNALIIAARYGSQAVEPILNAMQGLTQEQKFKILSQTISDGWNALISAARYHPQAVEPILKAMPELTQEQKFKILSQTSSDGWNALMSAAQYQPQAVEQILDGMQGLSQEQKIKILTQTNKDGHNALMLAARYHPQFVEPILNGMQGLSQEQKFKILSQTTSDGWNALMAAAQYQPQAVEPILNGMQGLTQEQKFKILSQTDKDSYNALKIAAQYQPQDLEHILKAMLELSQEKTYQILSQTANTSIILLSIIIGIRLSETYYSNTLMFAARNHPKAVEPTLKAMQELTPEQKFALLSKTNFHGRNALMLAAQYQPQAVEPILKSLSQLPAHYQYKYFKKNPLDKLEQLFIKKNITPNPILMSFLKLNAYRPKAKDLKAQAAVAKIEQLSQMYQQEKDLIPSDINQYLTQIQLIKIKHKDLDDRLLEPLKKLEQSLIQQRQAKISWSDEESFNETNIDSISPEWLKAHASEFKVIFQQLSPDSQNQLLEKCYKDLPPEDYQIIYNHLSIDIPGAKSSISEISFFKPQTQEQIPPENDTLLKESTRLKSRQNFDSLNMAFDLERLASGMSFYRNQLTSALSMHEKQKIYQESKKFFYRYLDKIQQFEEKHPGILQISMPSLDDLIPIESLENTSNLKSPSQNILLKALKTKNRDKISDAVEEVYQLSSADRHIILQACDGKLTRYIKDNPAKLYLLELERVKYQLEINNPDDPNIKVFNLLLLQLRADPEAALDYLTQAQVNFYRNLTWWQIVTGYFNGTGYGIGFLRYSLDNLLEKINENISVPASLRNS